MMFALLQTPDLPPLCAVKLVEDYGPIMIVVKTEDGKEKYVEGNHIIVKGTEEEFAQWLGGVSGFWLGEGSVMLQKFRIHHIKEELVPLCHCGSGVRREALVENGQFIRWKCNP